MAQRGAIIAGSDPSSRYVPRIEHGVECVFANNFQRIYHYHLKKCGGTSLNAWLSWHATAARQWYDHEADTIIAASPGPDALRAVAAASFIGSDVVHSHLPLRSFAPLGTFCCTVLRDPSERLASQIADWRREHRNGHDPGVEPFRTAFRDVARLSVREFLTANRVTLRVLFDNYMTRALAPSPAGISNDDTSTMMLDDAIAALETYHVVGLTEHMQETRRAIAQQLGLMHEETASPRLNVTNSTTLLADEMADAADIVDELTWADRKLYDAARQRFADQCSSLDYNEAAFDAGHAADAVGRLQPSLKYGDVVFNVSDVVIGAGLWPRDGDSTGNWSVWTGPARRSVLYMKCPTDTLLDVKLWVGGYADQSIRDRLTLTIDDVVVRHEIDNDKMADLLRARVRSHRPFLKIAIEVPETKDAPGDQRSRGLSFNSYGWRAIAENSFMTTEIPQQVLDTTAASEAALQGWCSTEKAHMLARLVLAERPTTCVEIGIYGGRSLVPVAAALKHNGAGVIYGIETWDPDVATENRTNEANDNWWKALDFKAIKTDFLRFLVEHDLVGQIRVIEIRSAQAAAAFASIDYLHIDGAHSIFNAAEDVVLYAKRVRVGGLVVFDDVNWQTTAPAIQVLKTICETVAEIKDEHGNVTCAVFRRTS